MYIDNNRKTVTVELPKFGSVTVYVQNGKVVRTEKIISEKFDSK